MDRLQYYKLPQRTLELPVFFPSISSVKSSREPLEHAKILGALRDLTDKYLVSAFDVDSSDANSEFAEVVRKTSQSGSTLLLDSGNYESFWLRKKDTWNPDRFHLTARHVSAHLTFSFDNQSPSADMKINVQSIVSGWRRDQDAIPSTTIIPIVHGETTDLPLLVSGIAQKTGVNYIAVAERELGATMSERCLSIRKIRAHLDMLDQYVLLHILGTGNPISMALFAFEGADSFDGLEWCQNVIDHSTGNLHHLSHSEFYLLKSKWNDINAPHIVRTIAHNLEYFSSWLDALRDARRNHSYLTFLERRLQPAVFKHLNSTLGWAAL